MARNDSHDARLARQFTTSGGTVMGAVVREGDEREHSTAGMIGGAFGVAGRGSPRGGGCELVLSSMGVPVARCRFDSAGHLLAWERL